MRARVLAIYRFLPVQLFLLHFRKAQMLLIFWGIITLTVAGNFASRFGADTLFLAPEYLGRISMISSAILGAATAVFTMAWNITTFIVHSKRIPYLGAARQAFIKYCINNSLLPLLFLAFYIIVSVRYQAHFEGLSVGRIFALQAGFLGGFIFALALAFFYFYRVDRDLLKIVLARITSPAAIRDIIPYDSLDAEADIVRADTFISQRFRIRRIRELEKHPHRLLGAVLRRHHRNATAATVFSLIVLLILGFLGDDEPRLRIPAGAGFLLLFSVMMAVVGAMKYFLKSWELLGWILFLTILSWGVKRSAFDLRSMAFGMNYKTGDTAEPVYDYAHLKALFTPRRVAEDLRLEEARLDRWASLTPGSTSREKRDDESQRPTNPNVLLNATTPSASRAVAPSTSEKGPGAGAAPLVVISVSGGGSRSAYWTFSALQHLDSLSGGRLFRHTVFLTGASGGMIGAAYWRAVHEAAANGKISDPYAPRHHQAVGKDLLNAVVFSFATVDLISPFNKTSIAGFSYQKDRGYALDGELARNTGGLLNRSFASLAKAEGSGRIPQMVISPTIVNDGRKLLMSALPVAYLTRPRFSLTDTFNPPIDAVDYAAFFAKQSPMNVRLTTALRINATFPYILPAVRMPSQPRMNLMDAGLRDNFGAETAMRYIQSIRPWAERNGRRIIYLQIRDTREHEVFPPTDQATLGAMITDPLTVIQHKWEPFQSYTHNYLRDAAQPTGDTAFSVVTLQYVPRIEKQTATLNFHLSQREKEDLAASIFHPQNRAATARLLEMLR